MEVYINKKVFKKAGEGNYLQMVQVRKSISNSHEDRLGGRHSPTYDGKTRR